MGDDTQERAMLCPYNCGPHPIKQGLDGAWRCPRCCRSAPLWVVAEAAYQRGVSANSVERERLKLLAFPPSKFHLRPDAPDDSCELCEVCGDLLSDDKEHTYRDNCVPRLVAESSAEVTMLQGDLEMARGIIQRLETEANEPYCGGDFARAPTVASAELERDVKRVRSMLLSCGATGEPYSRVQQALDRIAATLGVKL